jgi:uncharacterized membrane protein YhaH (DUF805 family)
MEAPSTLIAQTLSRIEDYELVDRWRQRLFSEAATPIAAAELKSRGIDPDKYVKPIDEATHEQVSNFSSSDRSLYLRLFSFKGRASRTKFWIVVPASWIAFILLRLYFELNFDRMSYLPLVISLLGLLIPIAWLHWATVVQRLHDRNKNGNWCALICIPVVGMIWSLIELGCLPGSLGANRFGKQ